METPTPTVRRVQPADAARMRALRLEMLADSPLAFLERLADAAARPHHEYAERIARASTGSLLAQFVAEPAAEPAADRPGRSERRAGGQFVAHAGAHVAADDPATTVLFAIYVSPAWRGQKLLAGLIDAVADWSRAAGRPELLLEVVVGNDRAVRAYQRLGFVDTGVRLPHPTLPTLTELQMRRRA
ncbi:GNAT family N-acetyltransferase [Micromonospora sp. LOL_023]|uniref:GNAT family N-acetyltransferase n=1 Tax=Micromonospora sp. LOL_023 TaxID=3345418 RepID=UPI003A882665